MTYQGDATALSGENEICDDCQAAAELHEQREEGGLFTELAPRLYTLKGYIRTNWHVRAIRSGCKSMPDSGFAFDALDLVTECAEEYDFESALEAIEVARELASQWGEAFNEREVAELLAQMRDYEHKPTKIGLEAECPKCIAICLGEEEHYDALARDHDAQR